MKAIKLLFIGAIFSVLLVGCSASENHQNTTQTDPPATEDVQSSPTSLPEGYTRDENGTIRDAAANIIDDAGNIIDDAGNMIQDAADGVGNAVKDMGDAMSNDR